MATTQAHKNDTADRRADVPGTYFGTDGAGFDHYYSMGSRKMTVVDGDDTRTFKIPTSFEGDGILLRWAVHTMAEHDGAYWNEIHLDPQYADVLCGRVEDEEFERILAGKMEGDDE